MFCGIDTHKHTLAVCIVDLLGRQQASASFANTRDGHSHLLVWATKRGVERFGVEGAGNYGLVLCQTLVAAEQRVLDVPANRTAQMRKTLKSRGKSDLADALAIARLTASDEPLVELKTCPVARDLQLLEEHRRRLMRERVQLLNRVHADLVVLRSGESISLKDSRIALQRCIDMLTPATSVQAELAIGRLNRLLELASELTRTQHKLQELLDQTGSTLTELTGLGPAMAALIIGQVGQITRYKTSDRFAAANGTAPIPASSGLTNRYRLNRFGNRKLNYALHLMAVTQLRCDPRAQAYVARHLSQGKTRKDAVRCLKRRLSDVVWRQMMKDHRATLTT